MMWIALLVLLGTFVLSVVSTGLVRAVALRRGFVDRPAGHKRHVGPVALGGGVGFVLAIILPILLGTLIARWLSGDATPSWVPEALATQLDGMSSKLPMVLGILAGALLLHLVGLIDDVRPLGPGIKFVVQFVVAGFVAGPMGIRVIEALPTPVSIALTVLWIVLITNAFNFLDNMDGLSAGVAAIAGLIFAVASFATGQLFVPMLALALVGGLCGFLIYNFSPASIFMGDAGSLVIGYLLAVLTILVNYYNPTRDPTPLGVALPIVVLAVPLYDVVSVVILRLRAGVSPFRGDWRHFSHRLVKRGMSHRGAVLTIYLATAATGLPAIILPQTTWLEASLLLVQCVCVVVMIAILEHTMPNGDDQKPSSDS